MARVKRREQVRRRFKAARGGAGLSQMEVASRSGISNGRYWRIENGYDEPTETERGKLARVLHVDESVLWPELASPQAPEAQAS